MVCSTSSTVIFLTTLKPIFTPQPEPWLCALIHSRLMVSTGSVLTSPYYGTVGGILRHVPLVVYDWLCHVVSPCFLAFPSIDS